MLGYTHFVVAVCGPEYKWHYHSNRGAICLISVFFPSNNYSCFCLCTEKKNNSHLCLAAGSYNTAPQRLLIRPWENTDRMCSRWRRLDDRSSAPPLSVTEELHSCVVSPETTQGLLQNRTLLFTSSHSWRNVLIKKKTSWFYLRTWEIKSMNDSYEV